MTNSTSSGCAAMARARGIREFLLLNSRFSAKRKLLRFKNADSHVATANKIQALRWSTNHAKSSTQVASSLRFGTTLFFQAQLKLWLWNQFRFTIFLYDPPLFVRVRF